MSFLPIWASFTINKVKSFIDILMKNIDKIIKGLKFNIDILGLSFKGIRVNMTWKEHNIDVDISCFHLRSQISQLLVSHLQKNLFRTTFWCCISQIWSINSVKEIFLLAEPAHQGISSLIILWHIHVPRIS